MKPTTMPITRLFIIVAVAMFAASAIGQVEPPPAAGTAPAGNTHPESQRVAGHGNLPNPFGMPATRSAMSGAQKAGFAEDVDLSPLRDLAVFHNGRVKILDTLALETVEYIAGKPRLQLPIEPSEGESAELVGFDPLFTLLDAMIDPAFYFERPAIHVNYLPLRRAYLREAFPEDDVQRQRWKKLTRVSPLMVRNLTTPIFEAHVGARPYREAIDRVENRLGLLLGSPSNMNIIAPETADDPWHHISEWPEGSEVRTAARDLGEAWRTGDAEAASEAAARLASILPTINEDMYPGGRRALEAAYNDANTFEWGYWTYFLSLLSLILAFGTGRAWLRNTGCLLLAAGIALHGAGFTARCILAERFAIQNQFESMVGLSLFAALVGLVVMIARRQLIFGAAAAAAGFLILITATETGIPGRTIEREAAILNTSVLLKYHVTTVLTSYGLITLGFVVSCFYLATHYASRLGGRTEFHAVAEGALAASSSQAGAEGSSSSPASRTLAELDAAQMVMLQLAFWTLGVGVLLGAWWADHSWGRWWAFDPKETWALITWIVYLIAIHARFAGVRDKALVTAWLSVVGFGVMLFTYFGVNLMLPGLHAYA